MGHHDGISGLVRRDTGRSALCPAARSGLSASQEAASAQAQGQHLGLELPASRPGGACLVEAAQAAVLGWGAEQTKAVPALCSTCIHPLSVFSKCQLGAGAIPGPGTVSEHPFLTTGLAFPGRGRQEQKETTDGAGCTGHRKILGGEGLHKPWVSSKSRSGRPPQGLRVLSGRQPGAAHPPAGHAAPSARHAACSGRTCPTTADGDDVQT